MGAAGVPLNPRQILTSQSKAAKIGGERQLRQIVGGIGTRCEERHASVQAWDSRLAGSLGYFGMATLATTFSKASRSMAAAASVLGVALGGMVVAPAPSFAAATFVCHGVMSQVCYFSVRHAGAARTDFALRHGESRQVPDAVAGVDRYLVTINVAPPERPESCSRTPSSGKHSTWCKLSAVSDATND